MDLMVKTDILIKFFDYLWSNNSFLYAIATVVFVVWSIYKNGLKIGKVQVFVPHSSFNTNESDYYKRFLDNIIHHKTKEESMELGYIIPPNYLYLYGRLWSTTKHGDLYSRLERDWKDINIIDVRDTNLTSVLISIIEDKAQNLDKLTIIHNTDQKIGLSYLKEYSNITFKEM